MVIQLIINGNYYLGELGLMHKFFHSLHQRIVSDSVYVHRRAALTRPTIPQKPTMFPGIEPNVCHALVKTVPAPQISHH
jgi:hypothetical protein